MGSRHHAGLLAVLAGLCLAAPAGAASRRKECSDACVVLVQACAQTCGRFADLEAACRKALLKRCRREGLEVCNPRLATTTTVATTTTRSSTTTTTLGFTGDTCADPIPLAIGDTVSGDTSDNGDSGAGGGCLAQADTLDEIYVVTPDVSGTLVLTISSDWDSGIYVRGTCDDPGSEIGCVDQQGGGTDELLQVSVEGGSTYYVIVDGYTAEHYGPYTLTSAME
jgi:hypothetical protein